MYVYVATEPHLCLDEMIRLIPVAKTGRTIPNLCVLIKTDAN